MKKSFFHLPENLSSQARNAFLIAAALTAAHFVAVAYYLYLGQTTGSAQFHALAVISFVLGVIIGFGAALSRRGQPTQGIILALGAMTMSYPPVSATLVGGLGLVLGLALMAIGPMSAFQILPRRSAWVMAILTFISGLATLLLDIFGSTARPSLPGIVIQILATSVVALVIFFIVGQFKNYSLSTKLTSILAVVFVLIAMAQFQVSSVRTRQQVEAQAEEQLNGYYQAYVGRITAESNTAGALSASIADRPDVQELYLKKDREGLYALLLPMFENLKERQIVHLYIENPDGTVFLRIHNPENFGDDVTYRGTAADALALKETVSGVEMGPNRMGVRGVSPMYSGDQFIGMIEVGLDFDEQFIADLNELTGADFTMWVTYESAAIPNLKPAEGIPGAPIEELFYYASANSQSLPVDPELYRSALATGKPAFQVVTENTPTPSIVYITPLLGYKGKLFGLLEISYPYAETLDALQASRITSLGVVGGLSLIGLFLIVIATSRFVLKPIESLTQFANLQMSGDSHIRVRVTSGDEFERLANTFNSLANSVEDERRTLEQRVAERTRNLELTAEVGRSVSQVRALDDMLKDAAELIRSRFDLYYVQVYLADPSQTNLILRSGTGDVGQQLLARAHRLPLDTSSINGRAAVEKRSVVIEDTAASAAFRPNPLLPDTRSEMAVPLVAGEKVVGVLDMQSEHAGSLSEEALSAFEALAGQLAVTIQNASLLAETEQARAEVESQARRLSRANWVDYLDAIHKPEETGFAFEQNKITALIGEEQVKDNALTVPITVTGESLGNLVVEMEGESPISRTSELVNTVARQVAQQIENLRLLESAERYRSEAEEAARRLTREGWQGFFAENAAKELSYVYDLNEVRSGNKTGNGMDESPMTLPLKVRDETVGKLSVTGLAQNDTDALELASAVAERLSAHIESLRQFEETQRGQIELDKRARQLAAVAEISSTSARELEIQKLLETVVHLTQRKFGLYHAHVFLFDEISQSLQIAACGWKEGDEHEGTHGTTAIPLEQEQSLVARAARTRQAVIVNDVRSDPGWLPNPLLPDTASEMAVPLVIGNQILGVMDVQSERLSAFSQEDANIQTTLASQIATALQNARSFTRAQEQAERESKLNAISQKIQSATTVEAVLQIAARELGRALSAPLTVAQIGVREQGNLAETNSA